MRRRRSWTAAIGSLAAAALMLPAGADSGQRGHAAGSRGHTAIFYYPWYSTPTRDGHWAHWYVHGTDGDAVLSTPYYPVRGLYSSSNATVIAAHMREIAATGIETVIVSWWGFGSPEDARLPLVAATATRLGLSVAIHLEPYHGRTPASVASDIEQLREKGFAEFYVYDAERDPAAAWATALDPLDGVQVLAHTHLVGRAKAGGFDGLYTYDVATWNGDSFARLCSQARRAGLLCAPSVGPGYDARLATTDELVKPRRHGATYDRMWRAAIRARPAIVTVTSYNEWQEGTQIEPARPQVERPAYDGAWGRRGRPAQRVYLEATTRWVARFRALEAQ
jgi:hypothetical protein